MLLRSADNRIDRVPPPDAKRNGFPPVLKYKVGGLCVSSPRVPPPDRTSLSILLLHCVVYPTNCFATYMHPSGVSESSALCISIQSLSIRPGARAHALKCRLGINAPTTEPRVSVSGIIVCCVLHLVCDRMGRKKKEDTR